MKFGVRTPSVKRRIAARTSVKRAVRHRAGLKAPRGMGIVTNPDKYVYNKVYRKTTVSVDKLIEQRPAMGSNRATTYSNDFLSKKIESKGILRYVHSQGNYKCQKCGNDNWAIVLDKVLFAKVLIAYCESCHHLEASTRLSKNNSIEQVLEQWNIEIPSR